MAYQINPEHTRFLFIVLMEMTLWIGVAAGLFYGGRFAYFLGSALRSWMRGDDRLEITVIDGRGRAHRRVIAAALMAGAANMAVLSADTVLNVCYGIQPDSWAWWIAGCWFL
jgi:hypothetical protein